MWRVTGPQGSEPTGPNETALPSRGGFAKEGESHMATVVFVDERPHFQAMQKAHTERPRQLNTMLLVMNVSTWLYAAVAGLNTLG